MVSEGESERRLLRHSHTPRAQEVPLFLNGGHVVPVHFPSFGLASVPWVFTKVLRPVAALIWELGMQVIFYTNDILLMVESKEKLQDQSAGLIYQLECLGFTINQEKTLLQPSQSSVFLGFTVDTTKMELSLSPDKSKKIREEARKMLGVELVSARSLSRLLGEMDATTEVIPHCFLPSTDGPSGSPQGGCTGL